MSYDGDRHVSAREIQELKEWIKAEFRTHRAQMLLFIGLAVGLIRLDMPTPVTAAAIVAMMAKGALALLGGRL